MVYSWSIQVEVFAYYNEKDNKVQLITLSQRNSLMLHAVLMLFIQICYFNYFYFYRVPFDFFSSAK